MGPLHLGENKTLRSSSTGLSTRVALESGALPVQLG